MKLSNINSKFHRLRKIMIILLTFLPISGCGYHFSPGGEYIDKEIRTVFVDNFPNRTSEANVEITFRTAFIDQFVTGGRFKIVDSREKADALFKGSIDKLIVSPISYQASNLAAEERVTVTMDLLFEEKGTQKIIWTYKNYSGYRDYRVTDVNLKETNRKDALTRLSVDTAERAYRLMMSGF